MSAASSGFSTAGVPSAVEPPVDNSEDFDFRQMAEDSLFREVFDADHSSVVERTHKDGSTVPGSDTSTENHCVEGTDHTGSAEEPAKAFVGKVEDGEKGQPDLTQLLIPTGKLEKSQEKPLRREESKPFDLEDFNMADKPPVIYSRFYPHRRSL